LPLQLGEVGVVNARLITQQHTLLSGHRNIANNLPV